MWFDSPDVCGGFENVVLGVLLCYVFHLLLVATTTEIVHPHKLVHFTTQSARRHFHLCLCMPLYTFRWPADLTFFFFCFSPCYPFCPVFILSPFRYYFLPYYRRPRKFRPDWCASRRTSYCETPTVYTAGVNNSSSSNNITTQRLSELWEQTSKVVHFRPSNYRQNEANGEFFFPLYLKQNKILD